MYKIKSEIKLLYMIIGILQNKYLLKLPVVLILSDTYSYE